ncbi:hypothetical protein [Novipirellula caenicola]|uniref:Uncharacterized protein n=1 Tax=Novipirellula caenicola TaxID=1536901 RepID=A0ABP9VLL6_9BACT
MSRTPKSQAGEFASRVSSPLPHDSVRTVVAAGKFNQGKFTHGIIENANAISGSPMELALRSSPFRFDRPAVAAVEP